MSTSRPIRFIHRGQLVEVGAQNPTRSLLQWLREDAHCTGTKEGCAEGDCGACTVLVAELATPTSAPDTVVGELSVRPANACIRFLPTLDGKAVFTVEDLAAAQGELHPAQAAMVQCHGSQCGFCTPGFVMSLALVHAQHQAHSTRPDRAELADALAGNLCRCTGYRPILDAGELMFELAGAKLATAATAELLGSLKADALRGATPSASPGRQLPIAAERKAVGRRH
jgi:xanthine dehydrogenase small subunit